MLNEMIEEQKNTMVLKEPERIADWDEEVLKHPILDENPTLLSGKTHAIRLLHGIFKQEDLSALDIRILEETMEDYPELTNEVKERFPHIFE